MSKFNQYDWTNVMMNLKLTVNFILKYEVKTSKIIRSIPIQQFPQFLQITSKRLAKIIEYYYR